MSNRVKDFISWHESDCLGALANRRRIFNSGTLTDIRRLVTPPVD